MNPLRSVSFLANPRFLGAVLAVVFTASWNPALAQSSPTDRDSKAALIYKIRTTDKLSIRIFQEDDLSTTCRVDAKGTVNLPLIGEVLVNGETLSQAESTIAGAYRDGRFLKKPEVTITVEEYSPREVSIQGQVRTPGRYTLPIESTMSVLDLVTKAGGFTDTAQGNAVRLTRTMLDGSTHVYTLDVESFIKGKGKTKTEESPMLLEPDDIIYVPERII